MNSISLAGNKLTGFIPSQMGYLGALISADMRGNYLGCTSSRVHNNSNDSSDTSNAELTPCDAAHLLPCFVELTDFTIPRSDSSNMACPEIRRKPHSQAVVDCGDETQLVRRFLL